MTAQTTQTPYATGAMPDLMTAKDHELLALFEGRWITAYDQTSVTLSDGTIIEITPIHGWDVSVETSGYAGTPPLGRVIKAQASLAIKGADLSRYEGVDPQSDPHSEMLRLTLHTDRKHRLIVTAVGRGARTPCKPMMVGGRLVRERLDVAVSAGALLSVAR